MEWISVKDMMPDIEEEVLVFVKNANGYNTITTAMYEDGTITMGESVWSWNNDCYGCFDYDEEKDDYFVPESWWEYRHYNGDDVYNNQIDGDVTHWMKLPKNPKDGVN